MIAKFDVIIPIGESLINYVQYLQPLNESHDTMIIIVIVIKVNSLSDSSNKIKTCSCCKRTDLE